MKHNKIIDCLEDKLKLENLNMVFGRNEEYDIKMGHGEIDLYMLNPKFKKSKVFEIKTNDSEVNKEKALHQLYKDKKYMLEFYNIDNVKTYYVFSVNERIIIEQQHIE